jgi:amino acid transporter
MVQPRRLAHPSYNLSPTATDPTIPNPPPHPQLIDTGASFATAMVQVGYPWASYIVAVGAVLGIITGVLANIMGVARILCSLSRTHLAPPLFGCVAGVISAGRRCVAAER